MVQDNLKYYGFVDDGNVRLEKGDCNCHGSHDKPSKPEEDNQTHKHNVKEVEDVLYFDEVQVGVDNYVRGGYFDFKRGVIIFDLGEGKKSMIEMSPLCEHVLNHAFVRYSGKQYPSCDKKLSIILENNEGLFGKCTDGGNAYSLASVSNKNKVEIGSKKMPIVIQGLSKRPNYNGKESLALVSDIPDMTNYARVDWVRKKIAEITSKDIDLSDYLTIEEADAKYPSKALTEEEINAFF